MPRWDAFRVVDRLAWIFGLFLVTGCVQSKTNLQDALARRVISDDSAKDQSTSREQSERVRARTDVKVRPAAAQPGQRAEGRLGGDRANALPPAIGEPPREANSEPSSPVPSLPSDSDEAALDA